MEIVIGLIVVAAVAYFAYLYFNKPTSSTEKTVDIVLPEPVVEPVIETAPPVVAHVSETESVEVKNTEVVPEAVPAKKAKAKVRAKTTKPAKAKKPKLEIAK